MRQIEGIEVHGKIFRYDGVTCQTRSGILLNFQRGSHNWDGIYPGMSWDDFYDNLIQMNSNLITPGVAKERLLYPLFVWPFKEVGICQRRVCKQTTSSKYCSIHCWYYEALENIRYAVAHANTMAELEANVNYQEKLMQKFGPLVELSCYAESAS